MILDGKKLQKKRLKNLKQKVSKMKLKPVLVIIQVGNNKESTIYINQKIKFGKKLGVGVEHYQLKRNVTFAFLKKLIGDFNNDAEISGIIVQLPLPSKLDPKKVVNLVDPKKDVDGLAKNTKFIPATARGVLTLLQENKVKIKGKKVTVLGRSFLVGGPIAKLMKAKGGEVTVCHSKTKNNKDKSQKADILISATGRPGLVKKSWTNEDQVIIDVGITKTKNGLKGDVDFEAVNKAVSVISPVPGGVGPMTVLSLFENLIDAAKKK
jgi:methylenetetrahydrofolate dehydrogenase (NADP+)/methenyltetrahydrofolate cyclohydrolase